MRGGTVDLGETIMITDERRADLYPQPDEVGESDTWSLPLMQGKTLEIDAAFLGVASARQDKHNHAGTFAPKGRRCPACRWYEPRIFKVTETGKYLLYTLGCSNLPGEVDVPRYRYAADAHEAIFNMATNDAEHGTRFLTTPAKMMFLMAAQHDATLAAALLDGHWVDSLKLDSSAVWRTT
jgi:hypothetical protein